jgi:hypothetical protein
MSTAVPRTITLVLAVFPSYLADDGDINVEDAINFLRNQSQDNSSKLN